MLAGKMNQALTPPNATPIGDFGLDLVVTIILAQLGVIGWLENSWGRIRPQINSSGKIEPWLHKSGIEYYQAYPNDTLTSFSCLYLHDDEAYKADAMLMTRTLSVIVWANLKTLGIDSPTVEALKRDVIHELRELDCVMSIDKSFDQTAVGPGGIYPGFDVSGLKEQYLTYPFGAFRIQVTVQWDDLC